MVNYQGQEFDLPITVVNGSVPNLMGRDWLSRLKPQCRGVAGCTFGPGRVEPGRPGCAVFPGRVDRVDRVVKPG